MVPSARIIWRLRDDGAVGVAMPSFFLLAAADRDGFAAPPSPAEAGTLAEISTSARRFRENTRSSASDGGDGEGVHTRGMAGGWETTAFLFRTPTVLSVNPAFLVLRLPQTG